MKKFFTLTIAAFASLGLFAADKVIALSDLSVLGNTYTYDGSEVKAKNNNVYVELPAADTKGNFTVYGSSDKNDRFLYIYGEHGTVKDESRSMVMAAEGVTIQYSAEDVILVDEKPYLLFSTADDFKFKKFEYTAEGVAPAENPVSTVTIEGPTEGNVGQTVTLKATFDVQPDTIFWTVDGAVQESHTATLKVELVAERTYQIGCWARNQYNAAEDWIIGEHSVIATAKAVLPQEDVTEATVWDWTKKVPLNGLQRQVPQKTLTPFFWRTSTASTTTPISMLRHYSSPASILFATANMHKDRSSVSILLYPDGWLWNLATPVQRPTRAM